MSPISSIALAEAAAGKPSKITQLYPYLELFAEGEPPRHALFVMGREAAGDQLLLIDPPADMTPRFRLEGQVAVLFTGPAATAAGLPLLQTLAGGVAHLRVGEHFIDLYTQRAGAVVHFPALGVLCSGQFGSDATVPAIAVDGDGSEELETLRLLARLVKQRRLQLLIPHVGSLEREVPAAMRRLAEDVAYLNGLQRVVGPPARRGAALQELESVAATLLPADRRGNAAEAVHRANVARLHAAHAPTSAE